MKQSKVESLIEAAINVIIGSVIALISQLILFPMFDIHITFGTDMVLVAWFTAISLARSYIIRRWCDAELHRIASLIAGRFGAYG